LLGPSGASGVGLGNGGPYENLMVKFRGIGRARLIQQPREGGNGHVGMGVSSMSMLAHNCLKQALEEASSTSRVGWEDVGVSDIMGKHEVMVVRVQEVIS
jgi:hypothetical protein